LSRQTRKKKGCYKGLTRGDIGRKDRENGKRVSDVLEGTNFGGKIGRSGRFKILKVEKNGSALKEESKDEPFLLALVCGKRGEVGDSRNLRILLLLGKGIIGSSG